MLLIILVNFSLFLLTIELIYTHSPSIFINNRFIMSNLDIIQYFYFWL